MQPNAQKSPVPGQRSTQKLSVLEKVGYSLGDLAANLIFQTLLAFLAFFYTDIYKIPAGSASKVMLIGGVIGACFNLVMGAIADRTQTRWGKFRPWVLWTAVPFGVISLLAFSTPHFSEGGKIAYAFITYFLLVIAYSANNLPYSALSGVLTGDMKERNSLSSYRFVAVMVAQFIIQVLLLPLALSLGHGDKAKGFEKVMLVFAITGIVCFIITFLTTRERIHPPKEQKTPVRRDLADLFSNRPWLIMLALTVLVFITLSIKGGMNIYYFKYYLTEQSQIDFLNKVGFDRIIDGLSHIFHPKAFEEFHKPGSAPYSAASFSSAFSTIAMIVGILFSKSLADKFGKRNIFGVFLSLSALCLFAIYFYSNTSVMAAFITLVLHGLIYGITIPILWAMIADVADYSEWKKNRRATAIVFSAMIFGLKLGLSVGGAVSAWLLSIFGYVADAPVQTDSAMNGIRLLISVVPGLIFIAGALLLFGYPIDKKMELTIETDLKKENNPYPLPEKNRSPLNYFIMPEESIAHLDFKELDHKAISEPLVRHIYTADPSAHVFDGRIYIYPSHDIEAGIPFDDLGSHFAMEDYHVFSMDSPDGPATDNGIALHVKDVPWAEKQLWAPDAAYKNGKYYCYFPAKRPDGIFQIGVAISDSPTGPFVAEPEAIRNSYSIDPAVFIDDDQDGKAYMYFGGLWGGQLQSYRNNSYSPQNLEPPANASALGPRVAMLTGDMLQFAGTVKEIVITDEQGRPLLAGDNDRRFFEASWMHKYNGKYYFSYSTGDTHFICYAIGDSPYGPFTYAGRILNPVVGWTSHHSILQFHGKWYLFYHDSSLSKGVTHLRSIKVTPLTYDEKGYINTIDPYQDLKILD